MIIYLGDILVGDVGSAAVADEGLRKEAGPGVGAGPKLWAGLGEGCGAGPGAEEPMLGAGPRAVSGMGAGLAPGAGLVS